MTECPACGSSDVELLPGEGDEPDVLTCYECGNDQALRNPTH